MRHAILLMLLAACSVEPMPSKRAPVFPGALARETALVVVSLRPDGSLNVDAISPRPIPFRARGPRFDETRHGARPISTAPSAGSPEVGSVNDPGVPDVDIPPPAAAIPTDGPCAIVVRHGDEAPTVVPVDLGQPGEGGGDVLDRWQNGSVILRAPYFGPGSRYTVVRIAARGTVALAERQVQP